MMRLLKKIFLVLSLSIVPPIFASEAAGGPPLFEDLIGFWKMEKWPNPDTIKVNPWPLPYQWFAFYKDGRLLSMMTSEKSDHTAKELNQLFSLLKTKSPQFQLNGQFLFVRDPNIKNYQETWGVNLFSRDVGEVVKKGDLVMSLAGGNDGGPVYFRLLRKIK